MCVCTCISSSGKLKPVNCIRRTHYYVKISPATFRILKTFQIFYSMKVTHSVECPTPHRLHTQTHSEHISFHYYSKVFWQTNRLLPTHRIVEACHCIVWSRFENALEYQRQKMNAFIFIVHVLTQPYSLLKIPF